MGIPLKQKKKMKSLALGFIATLDCGNCGQQWKYDADMTNDVFSIDSRYVYKRSTDGLGAFGGRHFEITAGNESGSGMLYTCVLPVQSNDLIYPLLQNSSCKQINVDVIDVADLFINTYPGTDPNGLAQLSAAAENYN